jgi:hypothetical protein
MTKPKTEADLSPLVIEAWQAKGYCVHGEVAVYDKAIFVDHIAHTGPCEHPEHIVAIEMKRNSGKSLRRQAWKLDIYHVADEIWGVVCATPRALSIQKWKDAYRGGAYHAPGLMSWEDEAFQIHVEPETKSLKYARKRAQNLLLVPENCGSLAGLPSGQVDYVTHYKLACERACAYARERACAFTVGELVSELEHPFGVLPNPRRYLSSVLRDLAEQGRLKKQGKRGRSVLWALNL